MSAAPTDRTAEIGATEKDIRGLGLGWIGEKGVAEDGTFDGIANARTLDRCDEIMESSGCQLDAYRANPVILACHQPWYESGHSPVIGKTIEIQAGEEAVPFRGEFAPIGLGPEYRALYGGRYMRAFSVGFLYGDVATETIDTADSEGRPKTERIRRVKTWELLEISAVGVPACREALIKAIRRGIGGHSAYVALAEAAAIEAIGGAPIRPVRGGKEWVRFAAAVVQRADQEVSIEARIGAIDQAMNDLRAWLEGRLSDMEDLLLSTPEERGALADPADRGSPCASGLAEVAREVAKWKGLNEQIEEYRCKLERITHGNRRDG